MTIEASILSKSKGKAETSIGVCIPICEIDAIQWLDRLLLHLSELELDIFWYLDNVSSTTLDRVDQFYFTRGWTCERNPDKLYGEKCRNYPLKQAKQVGCEWMLRLDCDEEVESAAIPLLSHLIQNKGVDAWRFYWYNVWEDTFPQPLIRFDPPVCPDRCYRIVLHRLKCGWKFRHNTVASAYCDSNTVIEQHSHLRIIHRGFSSPTLREMHRLRWDRLYPENPHSFWNDMCNKDKKAWVYPLKPWLNHDNYMKELREYIDNQSTLVQELFIPTDLDIKV